MGNTLKLIPLHLSLQDVGYDHVVKADPAEDPAFCKVKMFSPVEMDLAFVFAAHRDINKPELMDEWKRQGGVHQQEFLNFHLGWFTKKGPHKSPKNSVVHAFYG